MSRVTVIVISTIYMACLVGLSYTDKPCNPKDLYKCGSNESCQATDMSGEIGVCKCKTDFQRKVPDGPCIANPSPDVGPHSDPSNQPVSTEMPPTSSLSDLHHSIADLITHSSAWKIEHVEESLYWDENISESFSRTTKAHPTLSCSSVLGMRDPSV
ncbi:uncharacterized protein [Anabrus simplex]|uniref:uncharacterized protein isoform X2 n=1 Tax=Anabrus simplex TaxID=316456 RepID=UPI0034DCD131